jgi:hypothetical protein
MVQQHAPERKRRIVQMGCFGLAAISVVVLYVVTRPVETSTSRVEDSGKRETAAPAPPDFRIQSAGRLPQKLQGVSLGMTLDEVRAARPDLASHVDGYSVSNTATDRRLYIEVQFRGGHAVQLQTTRGRIPRAAADAYWQNALVHLGPPDVQERSATEDRFYWIDGDVRIRFGRLHLDCPADSNEVTLTIMYQPPFDPRARKGEQPDKDHAPLAALAEFDATWLAWWWDGIGTERTDGGEPLPRQLAGLELGMEPWQARAARPQLDMKDLNGDEILGELAAGQESIRLDFWQGKLYRIYQERRISEAEVPYQVASLSDPRWGWPEFFYYDHGGAATTFWSDRTTEMEQSLTITGGRQGIERTAGRTLTDPATRAQKRLAECVAHPLSYASSPEPMSLFSVQ